MRIDIGGRRLFFDVVGERLEPSGKALRQKPTLIVLHGSPGFSDHSALKPDLGVLSDSMQVIYLDLAGAGRSDDPPEGVPFSLELWADDIVRFCAALDIEKPVVLGLSGGGFVAQAYAIQHPDHAGGVVFAGTQAKFDPERSIKKFEELGGPEAGKAARALLCNPPTNETIAAFNTICMPLYNPTPRNPDAGHRIVIRPRLADDFHRYPDGIWYTFDLLDDLDRVRAPVLVLGGEEDPITPIQDSIDIVERLDPNLVTFVRMPGCGHGPWRDEPEKSFAAIRQFVDGLGGVAETA